LAVVFYFYKQKQRDAKKDKEEERAEIALKINSLAKQQKESTDKLSTVVETVSETVNNLKTIVEVIREQQDERDPRTERRLNAHSKEIHDLKIRVTKVETHSRLNHSPN
jgi:esterase/lipase